MQASFYKKTILSFKYKILVYQVNVYGLTIQNLFM